MEQIRNRASSVSMVQTLMTEFYIILAFSNVNALQHEIFVEPITNITHRHEAGDFSVFKIIASDEDKLFQVVIDFSAGYYEEFSNKIFKIMKYKMLLSWLTF